MLSNEERKLLADAYEKGYKTKDLIFIKNYLVKNWIINKNIRVCI